MAKAIVAAVLLGIAAIGTTAAHARDSAAEAEQALMAQGIMLGVGNHYDQALPIADRVIALIEKRMAGEKRRIYSGQSPQMLMANMFDAAHAGADAIDVGPAYGSALFLRGFALVELGRGDEAGVALDRAVAVSPSNPQFLCEDGTWHSTHHDFTGGLALFRKCEDNAGYADEDAAARWRAAAQRGRGYALIELGRLDEAEALYRARVQEDPSDAKARGELDYIDQQRRRIARSTS